MVCGLEVVGVPPGQGARHRAAGVWGVWTLLSYTGWDLGTPEGSLEWDSVILVGPLQLGVFYSAAL